MIGRSGLLILAGLAATGCGAVLDRSEFKPLTPVEIAEIKAKAETDKANSTGNDERSAASPSGEPTKPSDETVSTGSGNPASAAAEKPKPPSLFAKWFGSGETTSIPPQSIPSEPDKKGAPDGEASAPDKATAKADGKDSHGSSLSPTAPPEDTDEVSEAELAGEDEADPTKIAVPKPPVDDGLEHDFVNVYTSRPERPQDMFEGLPGVAWQGNLVLVSRGPDGDPRGLFGGEVQPYAHYVPGLPRDVVQAANGLLLAHSAINVSCVKPNLLGMIRDAERHFSRRVVITSGYRSPSHNRMVRGALHSQHLYCNAVDLYMPGIARDDLARYFYGHPARGGLGLYCHTKSIHVDTGRRREWRWSCNGRG